MINEDKRKVVADTLKAAMNLREELKKFRHYMTLNTQVIDKVEQRIKCLDIVQETLQVEIVRIDQTLAVIEKDLKEAEKAGEARRSVIDGIVVESLKKAGIIQDEPKQG